MSVTTIPLLEDLQGPWANFQVELVGIGTQPIRDVYPFISVTDLKRLIWIQQKGDPRWAPERVFLGVRSASGVRPIEIHWPAIVTGGSVDLPDPMPQEARVPNMQLVDDAGNQKPVAPTVIGSLILETALSPEIMQTGAIPQVIAIPLAALQPAEPETLSASLFWGFYRLYFPWLSAPGQVLDATIQTPVLRDAFAAAVLYTEDKAGRTQVVQKSLTDRVGGSSASMQTMVRIQWILPPPSARPESLERTFFGLRANKAVPFIRYFPVSSVGRPPLLKLGLNPDGSPILKNDRIFAQYLTKQSPVRDSAVIVAIIPLGSDHTETGVAFTLYMFEDGNCDITLEVPQRGATYVAAVAADAQHRLQEVVPMLGFAQGIVPMLRNIHATYKWTHPDPRNSVPMTSQRIQERVRAMTPFLDITQRTTTPAGAADTSLAAFKWRAVSNYESESEQFAFITQLVLKIDDAEEDGSQAVIINAVKERFGVSTDRAAELLEKWGERRSAAVAPSATAGSLAVAKHATGAQIVLFGRHPDYFIEVADASSFEELQRILSVMGVLLGASSTTIRPPAPAMAAVAASVGIADATLEQKVEETAGVPAESTVELGEIDPAMAGLMADLGVGDFGDFDAMGDLMANLGMGGGDYGGAGAGEEEASMGPALIIEEAEKAAADAALETSIAAPNMDAAIAAVEEECRGERYTGTELLRAPVDFYMAKLKEQDMTMFGFTVSKKPAEKTTFKAYSKSCQRGDERQPNIMTLSEYARIQRCYESRVRFVNLPPHKPSDLPNYTNYDPTKKYPDEYYLTDPESGMPMWTVYNYENKTRPGEYSYLMCAEFWCVRDNLPLLRSEFQGLVGRGFSKPPNTCPFCGGAPYVALDAPKPGESVIVRLPKESSGKLQQFIGTITRTRHPNGYLLPCCDTTPRLLEKYLEIRFPKSTKTQKPPNKLPVSPAIGESAAAPEDVAEPPPSAIIAARALGDERIIDYERILSSMQTQYILGNDKALGAGKIALTPPLLDSFFGQHSLRSVESRGIRTTFRDGVTLFLRLGVDSRPRAPGMNLYAGLAPFLGFNSAEQTQKYIMGRRMVRAFESANYGTLVHEFASKATVTEAELTNSLGSFANDNDNGYRLDGNRAHVIRLYKAWTAFLRYLADEKRPKKMRHFEHLLAQPGIITPRGLLLITLEQAGDHVDVVCPSFGIPPASIFGDVPVGFILHDKRDESWTPLVLYNGTKDAVRFFGERSADLELVPRHLRASLQKWIREWRSASKGCGRGSPPVHVWTPDKDTSGLPRFSQLRARMEGYSPTTIVRDRSNRLVGMLFVATGGAGADGPTFFVPCLDDGALGDIYPRVFEAEMIPPASLDAYMRFYQMLSTQYPALAPTKLLAHMDASAQIVGFMTAAGSMVPVAPEAVGAETLPVQQLDQFPWERDALILKSPNAPYTTQAVREETTASVEEQLAEAYEYLRLALSRWLLRDQKGPILRREMAALAKTALPLYEKRKRMDILLEPYVREWLLPAEIQERKALPLLREDCLTLPQEKCSGTCRWNGDRGCMIHAPIREATTDPIRIFTARLSDELLRYSNKRDEILNNKVTSIRTPRGVVRIGDELFTSTKEGETTKSILDRLGFTGQAGMTFPEEMMRLEGLEDEPDVPLPAAEAGPEPEELPESWREKGLQIPSPPADLEDAGRLAFASGTGLPLEKWEDGLKVWRTKLGLPSPDRPFQWSVQDFYVIAAIKMANLVFVDKKPNGELFVKRWIQPPVRKTAMAGQAIYMIFWGPRELLVTRGKVYVFMSRDLPGEFLTLLDLAAPMAEKEARGEAPAVPEALAVPEAPAVPEVQPAVAAVVEEGAGESKEAEQQAPAVVAVPEVEEGAGESKVAEEAPVPTLTVKEL